MSNWRKNQVGHWKSSSHSGKPPLDNRFTTVPSWEKKFCATVGSVPWRKLLEGKRYMHLHSNVVDWDDSAGKDAFDNAKSRFLTEMNGIPSDIPLPDPNIYIDDVDWDATVDPELYLDVEREVESCRNMKEKGEESVILGSSLLWNQSFSGPGWGDSPGLEPTGWGDSPGWEPTGWGNEEDKRETTKPSEQNYAASQGWESNQYENKERNSWDQYWASVDESAKDYGWQNSQNVTRGWDWWECPGGDLHNKYQGRNGESGNGGTWDDYNIRRENVSWSKSPGYHHDTNEYHMNRGRKSLRGGGGGRGGGRRGNFTYSDKVAITPSAW